MRHTKLFVFLLMALLLTGCGQATQTITARSASGAHKKSLAALARPQTKLTQITSGAIKATDKLSVVFVNDLDSSSPQPVLTPSVAGTWTVVANEETFTPKNPFSVCNRYKLLVPKATTSTGGLPLSVDKQVSIKVSCPSVLSLQAALSALGYTPYRFQELSNGKPLPEQVFEADSSQLVDKLPKAPSMDKAHLDILTKAATMAFQQAHGLQVDGRAGSQTWQEIMRSLQITHQRHQYVWVTVSERNPERLQIHRGAKIILSTLVNTGVSGAATDTGTYPIYARYQSTSMSGTFPDGSHYVDPDIPWVNYFNGGDAVHGYPRASYGFPQSNGCVELPIPTAKEAFSMLSLGDLVVIR
jgi:lipoprotein-anchoring transpeptidase ErfK/SrfK